MMKTWIGASAEMPGGQEYSHECIHTRTDDRNKHKDVHVKTVLKSHYVFSEVVQV